MATLSTKTLLIASGITGVGAVGTGTVYLVTNNTKDTNKSDEQVLDANLGKAEKQTEDTPLPKKISELLIGQNLKLLTKEQEDNSKWEDKWNKFKEAYKDSNPAALWEFQNWTQIKDEPNTINTFKTQCEKLSQITASNSNDATYLEVSKHCTKGNDE